MAKRIPDGVWPTMITPFTTDGSRMDWRTLEVLTNWYINSGVAGLFTVCLSSEMYQLSPAERLQLAEHVHTFAADRVPVVAGGTFRDCGTLEDQAEFMLKMSKHCEAVVIIVNQLADKDEDDDVWLTRARRLLELTGDITLGIYESPLPYHRTLSPRLMQWVASTNRFLFHKDTCQDKAMVLKKMAIAREENSDFSFFTAKSVFVQMCLENGASGFSGIAANFYPALLAWMCRCHADRKEDGNRVQRFLTLADFTLRYKYPLSAKVFHRSFHGLDISPAIRISTPVLDTPLEERDITKLQQMHQELAALCSDLGILQTASGGSPSA